MVFLWLAMSEEINNLRLTWEETDNPQLGRNVLRGARVKEVMVKCGDNYNKIQDMGVKPFLLDALGVFLWTLYPSLCRFHFEMGFNSCEHNVEKGFYIVKVPNDTIFEAHKVEPTSYFVVRAHIETHLKPNKFGDLEIILDIKFIEENGEEVCFRIF